MRCIDCRYHTWVDAKYHCNVGKGKPMEIIGDIALRDMPCDIFDKTEKKRIRAAGNSTKEANVPKCGK